MHGSIVQEPGIRGKNIISHNFKEFNIGDLVLLKDNYRCGKGSKLKLRWLGPYCILEKYSPVNYTIKHLYDNHKRQEKVHINHLKICHLPNMMYDLDIDDNQVIEEAYETINNESSDTDDEIIFFPKY